MSIELMFERKNHLLAHGHFIVCDLLSSRKPPCGAETAEKNFAKVCFDGGFEQSETTTIATRELRNIVATGMVSYVVSPQPITTAYSRFAPKSERKNRIPQTKMVVKIAAYAPAFESRFQ